MPPSAPWGTFWWIHPVCWSSYKSITWQRAENLPRWLGYLMPAPHGRSQGRTGVLGVAVGAAPAEVQPFMVITPLRGSEMQPFLICAGNSIVWLIWHLSSSVHISMCCVKVNTHPLCQPRSQREWSQYWCFSLVYFCISLFKIITICNKMWQDIRTEDLHKNTWIK